MDKILLKVKKPFVFTVGVDDAAEEVSFSQEDEENPKMMKIDWGDGTIDEKAETTISHTYEEEGDYVVKVYHNGALCFHSVANYVYTIQSPIYISLFAEGAFYPVCRFAENLGSNVAYFNTNNSFDQSETASLLFGSDNWQEKGLVNINTGLAEWINLEEMKDSLGAVYLYCRNLYWDWKPLEFAQQITLYIAPDPITFKTCVEYFATKATYTGDKPDIYILKGSQQDELYEWALQYEEKFNSINKN